VGFAHRLLMIDKFLVQHATDSATRGVDEMRTGIGSRRITEIALLCLGLAL